MPIKHATLCIASVLLSVAVTTACGKSPESETVDSSSRLKLELDAYMEPLEMDGFSGVVLVVLHGEPVYRRAFGFAGCNHRVPMTPDHLLMIGSITKELTQILAFKLAEEGRLNLDDQIGRFFPSLPEEKAVITVREILDHRAGLPDLVNEQGEPVGYTIKYDYEPVSREQMLDRFAKAQMVFDPGEQEQYSNLGYDFLAALLEETGGASYIELLRSRIFEPAGMETIDYVFANPEKLQFADGCRRDGSRWGSPATDEMWGDDGPSWNLKGAGGLIGRADDLSALFDGLNRRKIFGPEMQDTYLDTRLVFIESLGERGMGPAGSNGIFNAAAFWGENSDMRVVMLTNHAQHQAENYARDVIRKVAEYR